MYGNKCEEGKYQNYFLHEIIQQPYETLIIPRNVQIWGSINKFGYIVFFLVFLQAANFLLLFEVKYM